MVTDSLQVKLLILQATPFCNLDCSYCYLPNRSDRALMQGDTLDAVVRHLLADELLGSQLTLNWHAGEPLVPGVAFYRDAFERLAPLSSRGTHVVHSIQTNATLIDEKWCRFFSQTQMRVGVSLDGPAAIHDAARCDRKGRGTHARAMAGIARLREAGIPFSVITVLTERSVDHADAMYEFFIANDIAVLGFNIEEREGANAHSTTQAPHFAERYQRFLQRFHELVQRDRRIAVREFEYFENRIRHERSRSNDQVQPLAILSVAANGDFSTFSPELLDARTALHGDFVLGNVHQGGIRAALLTSKFASLYAEICAGVNACRDSCEHFIVCGGGAPSNKLFENGRMDTTVTDYCRYTKKAIAELVLGRLLARAARAPA
jgi:uncharacterized protein